MKNDRIKNLFTVCFVAGLLASNAGAASGDGVTFTDIAANGGAGVTYQRTKPPRNAILDKFKQPGAILHASDIPFTPGQPRGNPGVAVFDFDGDGDLDIYVTNGPGTPNSLYANQLRETGGLEFIDVGVKAGVGAILQDSQGVCYGDIDNDGDEDLYVLGGSEPNILFENLGNGTFRDITAVAQVGGGNANSLGCSFGDVNGDGLLDLVVGNLYNNFNNRLPLMIPGFENLDEHNQLFINMGNNRFEDRSATSGIQSILGSTWAIALVDYDVDGDLDIIAADDQGTRRPAEVGGKDYGYIRVLQNDGTGKFTYVTEAVGLNIAGDWMGLAFGDINGDGYIDMFASNIGDYIATVMGPSLGLPTKPNQWSSRWFLLQKDGTFLDPGIGALGTTPFGWAASIVDYDNDADLDILYHGGMNMSIFSDATNPGAILRNDGLANFHRDKIARSKSTNHSRRAVQGMAIGDLNRDGFIDIVSVSSENWPEPMPLPLFVAPSQLLGGEFDDVAYMWPTFLPINPSNPAAGFVWSGNEPVNGTLSVEISSADNENKWARVHLLGAKGLTASGKVNRDGIGAVVSFRTKDKKFVTKPVVSGGSHASSDSLELIFGLGASNKGTLEVLWPGGVRNRLYDVRASEDIVFPEIPCSFSDKSQKYKDYHACVVHALKGLENKGMLKKDQSERFLASALRAFRKDAREIDVEETDTELKKHSDDEAKI